MTSSRLHPLPFSLPPFLRLLLLQQLMFLLSLLNLRESARVPGPASSMMGIRLSLRLGRGIEPRRGVRHGRTCRELGGE